jgi:hypothetical protein
MTALARDADLVLRSPVPPAGIARPAALVLVLGLFYGAVMGTFGGLAPQRLEQIAYSALKVPILLLVTFVICLPSFFLLNTLTGLRRDFAEVARALVATQAALTVVLAALAPYTALWYVSFTGYQQAILFNGAMFALASAAAQVVLWRLYRPLMARQPRHHAMAFIWLGIYVFVGIQMAWVLRPYVGHPGMETQFLREDSWSNAYVFIARTIWQALGN